MAQAEAELDTSHAPQKSGRKGLLIGGVLALILGGGGFYAVHSGMILGGHDSGAEPAPPPEAPVMPNIAFIPLDPILVSLGSGSHALRFLGQLEVDQPRLEEVTKLLPRVIDVLNSYLRAVEPVELEDPAGLMRLRAQMLRRIQVVVGEGRVRDLLIMEFVFN
ncbi:flagellar basal body-associated FliL family protein [Oceaniglobus roseus]|uniref:flagellar basal body-associated FliL family protein n=1 Tax=Oceaniglobus roseus TaxID=1737570 RepID=UPI000C7EFBE2|nr:flagellar basal body-associated FliL family protein [Kandeliimicrobium roseum]